MTRSRRIRYAAVASALALAIVLTAAACGSSGGGSSASSSPSASANSFVGAGSTFAQPLYTSWAKDYQGVASVQVNYQGVGSTAGIAAIEAKTVQFGATDAPLNAAQLQSAGLVQFPTAVGGTVAIVNLKSVPSGTLKLDGPTLANIYLGTITKWNDAAIAKLNPGVKLPSSAINVVHRSDGSGTSWIFTSYLSAVYRTGRARWALTPSRPGRWAPAAPRAPASRPSCSR
jgi:phosphate transport system substrate-binding protein